MDNKQLGIIGVIIIIIVIIICAFAFLGGNSNNSANVVTEANTSNSTTTNVDNSTSTGNYQLQINTTGKWRLDLTVDGKYSSNEGTGSKTLDLGDTLGYASVTVNQEGGPTNVYLLKDGQIIDQGSSNSDGIETIYFYYQA